MLTYDIFENYERGAKVLICPRGRFFCSKTKSLLNCREDVFFSLAHYRQIDVAVSSCRGNGNRADADAGSFGTNNTLINFIYHLI